MIVEKKGKLCICFDELNDHGCCFIFRKISSDEIEICLK